MRFGTNVRRVLNMRSIFERGSLKSRYRMGGTCLRKQEEEEEEEDETITSHVTPVKYRLLLKYYTHTVHTESEAFSRRRWRVRTLKPFSLTPHVYRSACLCVGGLESSTL